MRIVTGGIATKRIELVYVDSKPLIVKELVFEDQISGFPLAFDTLRTRDGIMSVALVTNRRMV